MPRPNDDAPSYLDEDHQLISEFSERYFDDDEERGAFVNDMMDRLGYERVEGWGPRSEDPSKKPPGRRSPVPSRRRPPSGFRGRSA